MAKPKNIELGKGEISIPILYEDRSVLALDKPGGWMLAPDSWDRTGRNLQLALQSSLSAGDFWARSRGLKYLRFIHRLDAETTGITLFAKSAGALRAFSEMFEARQVEKYYWAVVRGVPKTAQWSCDLALMADPGMKGRMKTVSAKEREKILRNDLRKKSLDRRDGPDDAEEEGDEQRGSQREAVKDAETHFRVVKSLVDMALVEARPVTGRTHQIRVHLAAAGHPVAGDALYGTDKMAESKGRQKLALRAVKLVYQDPFQKRRIWIEAPTAEFLKEWGF
jgi:23S rRNA-/tRNA-specific pseudouridylate synthase